MARKQLKEAQKENENNMNKRALGEKIQYTINIW